MRTATVVVMTIVLATIFLAAAYGLSSSVFDMGDTALGEYKDSFGTGDLEQGSGDNGETSPSSYTGENSLTEVSNFGIRST